MVPFTHTIMLSVILISTTLVVPLPTVPPPVLLTPDLDPPPSPTATVTITPTPTVTRTPAPTPTPTPTRTPTPTPAIDPARGAAMPYQHVVCGDADTLRAGWRYDWWYEDQCPGSSVEYVPMVWHHRYADDISLSSNGWLMGPNEPNYRGQAVASPADVAGVWHYLEATGRKLASPAVSACEDPDDGNCLNPNWLEEWAALCQDCRYEAVALHWYGCNAGEFADYLDMRHAQFPGKQIWITEFGCQRWGDPERFMRQALAIIEQRSWITRHAWFATRTDDWPWMLPLVDGNGLTSLGRVYVE